MKHVNVRRVVEFAVCSAAAVAVSSCRGAADPIAATREAAQVEIEANQAIADPLVHAIEEYERDHGKYPERLESLVPAYLETIPETVADAPFWYYVDDMWGFVLGFDVSGGLESDCGYTARFALWDCGWSAE
jgi:hypothetical protein